MENESVHLLWVSSVQSVPAAVQQLAQQADLPVRVSQAAPYDAAIQAVQCDAPDAVFVMDDFDALAILEFVHHARLLNSQISIVILCDEYDAALDYKSRKLGATDCVTLGEVDAQYLQQLLAKKSARPEGHARQAMRGASTIRSFLQFPIAFK